jgi:hypothetical protein
MKAFRYSELFSKNGAEMVSQLYIPLGNKENIGVQIIRRIACLSGSTSSKKEISKVWSISSCLSSQEFLTLSLSKSVC